MKQTDSVIETDEIHFTNLVTHSHISIEFHWLLLCFLTLFRIDSFQYEKS